ncbi:MAG: YdcF family protein [Alcaligenaceae bacterium]|nr:YdcF family protein [Alcaligenaceae bacterium]
MSLIVSKIISSSLLIPLNFMILLLIAWFLLGSRFKKAGRALLMLCIVVMTALSLPVVSTGLLQTLYQEPALSFNEIKGAQAIVVLGGGAYRNQADFGAGALSASSLERVRYAAFLHQKTGLPIQTSGGAWEGEEAVADIMKRELETLFHTPVKWVLNRPATTAEEAQQSRELLAGEGINTILLVTNAFHMLRAKTSYERAGFNVIAAPTVFPVAPPNLLKYVPTAEALWQSNRALHEWIGIAWYWFRGA